jgi:hypothetical protein
MLHLYDRATMAHALTLDLDAKLHRLLADRIGALTDDLIDHTEYLIVQPGDTEADIVRHVGFSPLIDPIDGVRYGKPDFHPHWDWLAEHDGWFELIFTFGSTFCYIVLIADAEGVPTDLLRLCRTYAKDCRERS